MVSLITTVAVQVAVTAVAIGYLKRAGVLRINPEAIRNHGVRETFVTVVGFGEGLAEKAERLVAEFQRSSPPSPR